MTLRERLTTLVAALMLLERAVVMTVVKSGA